MEHLPNLLVLEARYKLININVFVSRFMKICDKCIKNGCELDKPIRELYNILPHYTHNNRLLEKSHAFFGEEELEIMIDECVESLGELIRE